MIDDDRSGVDIYRVDSDRGREMDVSVRAVMLINVRVG